jgi:hypothetical protein
MHRRPASRLRLLVGGALVALLTMVVVRAPTSGASDQPVPPDAAARAVVPPGPLPSLAAPMPSVPLPLPSVNVPLPSINVASPLPSASLPLPSASLPLPSISPLPSVPLPSASLPLPSVSQLPSASLLVPTPSASPNAAPTSEPRGTSDPDASPVSTATTPAPPPPDRPLDALSRGGGVGDDRRAPTGAGRAGPVEREPASPSWLVPALAFGVPLLLVVGAVVAQLVGGAAVLGVARRVLSRHSAPAPRWMCGASDNADG